MANGCIKDGARFVLSGHVIIVWHNLRHLLERMISAYCVLEKVLKPTWVCLLTPTEADWSEQKKEGVVEERM